MVRIAFALALAVAFIAVLLAPVKRLVPPAHAGTTGTICGRIVGSDGQPVDLATVMITEKQLGTYTDAAGNYCIVNIPPGTYEVYISRLGFESMRIQGVNVSADITARLDLTVRTRELGTEEVVVTAKRDPVDLHLTSSAATVSADEIESLPVQELQDIVDLQAGVVDGHFRGGRLGEVQYQVDGVSVNNAFNNASILKVDRSLLQEVQVMSGTFDAEYGQAMSGVVNAVLKEGTEDFRWSAEVYGGAFLLSDAYRPGIEDHLDGSVQSYQATVRGPLPFPRTVFMLSGRRYLFDDYVDGVRAFVPTDSSDFEDHVFIGTGDGDEVPLGYSDGWSGFLKLTSQVIPTGRANYQLVIEELKYRVGDYAFRLNPDGLSNQQSLSLSHGIDWTQSFGQSTYLSANLRQNYFDYSNHAYEDVFDARYDAAGRPVGDPTYELGAYVQGVDFTRYVQETNAPVLKASLVTQSATGHGVKIGGELALPDVTFGVPGHLTYTTLGGRETLVRHVDEPPDYPGPRTYHPVIGAAFVQDQVVWADLTLRAGLRYDVFDARSTVPSDPANPANAIEGVPASHPQPTTTKDALSPRLGVAYPVSDRAAIHFAYGHFRQLPAIGEIFANADYAVLANLQAGAVSYGVMGNPDVSPEETVQYEAGYKHAFDEDFGVDVTTFYKDIRDLLGVEFVSTYNGAEYARLTNVDFGSVLGATLSLDHHALGPFWLALDYTWQRALGNSSDPRETATRASAGEDPRPRLVAFNWDQRHTFNLVLTLEERGDYVASAVFRAVSGQPYTPVLEAGFGGGLATNSGRKPPGAVLDLRMEKQIHGLGPNTSFFANVLNVSDARYFNGPVYSSTGSPYYSRFPATDAVSLADPTRFYAPRRIEVGVRLGTDGL